MKTIRLMSLAALLAASSTADLHALDITAGAGWLETASVKWTPCEGATLYNVYYIPTGGEAVLADTPLTRRYPDGLRADIPGLKAGTYTLRVDAVDASGKVIDTAETSAINVEPNNREGFAFTDGNIPGGYNLDGTPKEGARIIYVTPATVNTVVCPVANNKGVTTDYTGLAAILEAYGKGYDKTPLIIRMIGAVTENDFTGLKDGNYINFQGSNNTTRLIENITLEGIGSDATLYGYGICFKRAHNIEIRNLGIMLFGDDAISMDTDNTNIWLHNLDFFYGKPGHDADQVKGDGSIDMKYRSTRISIAYNHFFDSGKVMGCGGTTGEDVNLLITYHHNWFDHTDSRCPRLHYTTAHVYNNYYDGVPVYSIGNTTESNAFVEGNYFRNCKRPLMISGQGTDAYDSKTGTYTLKGTFSGQDGGMTKAYDNVFTNENQIPVWHTVHATQFDAYLASERNEVVPETVVSVKGKWVYNNFDTAPDMYVSMPDAPADIPTKVTGWAGRQEGGDFKWQFDNSVDDENHDVNQPLKQAILSYTSKLLAVQGDENFNDLSGLETVIAAPVSEAAYYDLQGRRVDASTHGILIKATDGKAMKIKN